MMLNIQIQAKIEISQLLQGATQLTLQELEAFVNELQRLIEVKKSIPKARREKQLLAQIQFTALDAVQRERYRVLSERLERETISEVENLELHALIETDEALRNKRVQFMIELAQVKQVSFHQMMLDLGLKPLSYGG